MLATSQMLPVLTRQATKVAISLAANLAKNPARNPARNLAGIKTRVEHTKRQMTLAM